MESDTETAARPLQPQRRPYLAVRGIYGGIPEALLTEGCSTTDCGINAIWLGTGALTAEKITQFRDRGVAAVYAEFNTMHFSPFVSAHPDAAPVGPDGHFCPPPDGWQGACPTHPGYRQHRRDAFREALATLEVDGIWLDYHHLQSSWEQAIPNLPDTCFCSRCLTRFQEETGTRLPDLPTPALAERLLGALQTEWSDWRCAVLTDWVRDFREIRDAVRPDALLGTFHCPWTETERDGALRHKLGIDLQAQAAYLDIFSIMPYHARFGHAGDVEWIAQQTQWLGDFLGITGTEPGPAVARGPKRIWPIVQLSDWGETVPAAQVAAVLEAGTRLPATGITVFNGMSLASQTEKIAALCAFYEAISAL